MTRDTWYGRLLRFARRGFGRSGQQGREPAGSRAEHMEGNCSADERVEGPGNAQRVTGAASDRNGHKPSNDVVAGGVGGNIAGRAKEVSVLGDNWRDFIHGGRSLAASAVAGFVLVALDFFDPSGPNEERVLGAFAAYFCGLWAAVAADRWLYRRKLALPPPDRFGDGRFALVMASAVLWLSGVEAGTLLAPWLAVAAVVIGSWADGSWIFRVSSRRGVGFWRAWRELLTRDRMARKQYWTALFGEDGR